MRVRETVADARIHAREACARALASPATVRIYNRVAYRVYRVAAVVIIAAVATTATIRARALSACVHLVYNCGAHRTHDLYKIDTIVCSAVARRELAHERKRERSKLARIVHYVVVSGRLLLEYMRPATSPATNSRASSSYVCVVALRRASKRTTTRTA